MGYDDVTDCLSACHIDQMAVHTTTTARPTFLYPSCLRTHGNTGIGLRPQGFCDSSHFCGAFARLVRKYSRNFTLSPGKKVRFVHRHVLSRLF